MREYKKIVSDCTSKSFRGFRETLKILRPIVPIIACEMIDPVFVFLTRHRYLNALLLFSSSQCANYLLTCCEQKWLFFGTVKLYDNSGFGSRSKGSCSCAPARLRMQMKTNCMTCCHRRRWTTGRRLLCRKTQWSLSALGTAYPLRCSKERSFLCVSARKSARIPGNAALIPIRLQRIEERRK